MSTGRRGGTVAVGIPVRNGGALLSEVLRAVLTQQVEADVELLVVDSGSTDGSVQVARSAGAEVIAIDPSTFTHGGARNLIMERTSAPHVALLTQDAVPASRAWLASLLAGFDLAPDVALVYGPYLPRPGASHMVRRELTEHFASLSPGGGPRVDRLSPGERVAGPGAVTFFTSANAGIRREAWERVPFRPAPYAEDQLLAVEMLETGFAKAYCPDAAVVHSHDYRSLEYFRRCFDEWRGLREVYGHVEPASPRRTARVLRDSMRADARQLRADGAAAPRRAAGILRSLGHHLIRAAGAILGSRADRLPPAVRRMLSLERRASFEPRLPPPGNAAR